MKKKPLITIVIPLKNTKEYHRETTRLKDCLNSLQNQAIPYSKIDVIIADIDSDSYYKKKHKEICDEFKARYIYIKTDDIWNISRARNIGIRNAQADYVMTTDVDCVFAPDFIEIVLKNVDKNKIIHCRISDLPKEYSAELDNFLWMNKVSTLRPPHGYGGCQVFPKKWAFKVRGFDEDYKGWGADDTDFYHRATHDGLKSIWIEKETSFFHQWHSTDNRQEDRIQVNSNRTRCSLTEMGKLPIIRNDSGWGGEITKRVLPEETKGRFDDTAILVTTFMRDSALFQCVKSIRKYYPDIAIFVGDNGKPNTKKDDFCKDNKCFYIKTPFDCGVGATRNKVFEAMPKQFKYIVICEDDVLFTEETRLNNWIEILNSKRNIGVAGGILKKHSAKIATIQNYEAWLYAKAATLYVERIERFDWKLDCISRYSYCDIVINIFMMKRDVWNDHKWDPEIKTWPEHEDFFFLLKKNTDWKVVYTDTVSLIHKPMPYNEGYSKHRMRTEGAEIFSKKLGIEYIWSSWHKAWGKPNPMRIAFLIPENKKPKYKIKIKERKDIAIGIKTFLREESFFETLNAIEEYFPLSYKLYIADDGHISDEKECRYQGLEKEGHEIMRLPFNSGISVGRNEIVKRAEENYLLIMDDDIAFQDSLSIKHMKAILDSDDDIGICAGMLLDRNGMYLASENYQKGLRFEFRKGLLFRHPSAKNINKVNGSMFLYADQVVNFFIAKKEVFEDVKWDNRIKVEWEHMDFFLRLKKTRWRATVCLNAKVTHLHSLHDPDYNFHRRSAPTEYFKQKHKIHDVINRFA